MTYRPRIRLIAVLVSGLALTALAPGPEAGADSSDSAGPLATPVANCSLSPTSVFPGDTVTITNTSTGTWTRSAIWVTDDQGTLVAGSDVLAPSTPSSRSFVVPDDLDLSDSFTVHVAVGSDTHPYNPGAPGDQLAEGQVPIDRTPQATFITTPGSPITGDTVTLDATAEGHPSGVGAEDPYRWTVYPPYGGSFQLTGDPSDVILDASGTWTFELEVNYMHQSSGGGDDPDADGMYEATDTGWIDVSSVAAAFTVSPATPLSTELVTLDGSPSPYQAGATVVFDWTVSGPSSYTGCGNVQTCQIPADTLAPGSYTITLTLTNTDNGDTSLASETVTVQDGTATLSLTGPPSAAVGETAMFSLDGAPDGAPVTWDFGGPHCDGDPQQLSCTYPGAYGFCATRGYIYATTGTKMVTATVSGVGSVQHQIDITPGDCGSCSYAITPTSATFDHDGGAGSIAVTTQSGCEWSATTPAGWITITAGWSGTGPGTVSYQVAANGTGGARYGSITVGGKTLNVTQTAPGSTVDFTFTPVEPEIGETVLFELVGLDGDVEQAVWNFGGPGCSGYTQQTTCTPNQWDDCSAITYKYASSGAKTVTLTVTLDGGGPQPTATHTLAVQNNGSCGGGGGACSYSVSPTAITVPVGGGSGTIQVTTANDCAWTAVSNSPWVHVTSGASATGSGTVEYSVDANSGGDRTGTMTVAVKTVSINQSGSSGSEEGGPMLVPAVASLPGLEGTTWKSDLRIFNPRDEQLTIDIQYVPESGDETSYPRLVYVPDPQQTVWIDDMMYWFAQGEPAKGALIITYSPQDGQRPLIVSRTFNDTDDGTYGQSIPASSSSSLADAGQTLYLAGIRHGEDFRTNIGLVNVGSVGCGVTVRAIDEIGVVVAENSLSVPAGRYTQLGLASVVGDPGLDDFTGSVVVHVESGGPLAAWASIVDQQNGDPIFLAATLATPTSAPLLIPAIAKVPGLAGTNWRSDLRLFNPRDEQMGIEIRFVPEAGDPDPQLGLSFPLASEQTVWIDDFVDSLPGINEAKGALLITHDPDDGPAPAVTSRTFNDTDEGTFGQLIPLLDASSLATVGETLTIPGVQHDAAFRTNIGLVNTGDAAAAITVRAFSEAGLMVAENWLGVPAGRYMQLSLGTAVGDPGLTGFRGTVVVQLDNGGPLAAYGSMVDQQTGDPILISGVLR